MAQVFESPVAVLAVVPLLDEARTELQQLAGPVQFPEDSPTDLDALVARTGDATAVLVAIGTPIAVEYFERCPQVRYVGVCGTSLSNVAVDAAAERGVRVDNVRDYGDEPTAEYVFMQLVSLARGLGQYRWRAEPHELMGKRLLVVGLGALGASMVNLGLAYKMRVSYHSRTRKPEWEARGARFTDLDSGVAEAEIVILTGPTDVELLGEAQFERLGAPAILVQASTGRVFAHGAFLRWVAQPGAHAIFDLAAGETAYDSYASLPRVVFPRVMGGHSIETRQRLGRLVVANLTEYLGGS